MDSTIRGRIILREGFENSLGVWWGVPLRESKRMKGSEESYCSFLEGIVGLADRLAMWGDRYYWGQGTNSVTTRNNWHYHGEY